MRHPQYAQIKQRGPSERHPVGTILLRWWEHCEVMHDATPEEFGMNVKAWHDRNHPFCELPTHANAKNPEWRDVEVIDRRTAKTIRLQKRAADGELGPWYPALDMFPEVVTHFVEDPLMKHVHFAYVDGSQITFTRKMD